MPGQGGFTAGEDIVQRQPGLMRSPPRFAGLVGQFSRFRIPGTIPDIQLKIGIVVGNGLT